MAPLPSGRPEQAADQAAVLTGAAVVSSPPERASGPAARLTGRGAVLTMAGVFLIGLLLAAWLGWAVLAGLAFVAGCVLAARYATSTALLTVVVSPPLLFLAAVILVSAVTVPGGLFMSVVVGSVVTLASVAPWLALGMVLTVIITWIRGLPRCIQDLRRELRSG
jgi:MFS family permease